MDGQTDGRTDGRMDRPSYRDAFLTDASKKSNKCPTTKFTKKKVFSISPKVEKNKCFGYFLVADARLHLDVLVSPSVALTVTFLDASVRNASL